MDDKKPNRTIRIFISSTFKDMQAERELLMKKVFPRLRQIAVRRDADVIPVDLRWGITDEEAENREIVEYCLKEIEDSKPFFIGIIGERYGWVPSEDDVNFDKNGRFGWIYDEFSKGRSITDIEIRYGALYNPFAASVHFYIKNCRSEDRMEELKDEIRKSGFHYSGYSSPDELAEKVENDFMVHLDELFPERKLSGLEKIESTIAQWRSSKMKGYISTPDDLDAAEILESETKLWAIIGPAGSGKSIRLLKLAETLVEKHNKDVIYCPLEIMDSHMTESASAEGTISRYIKGKEYVRLWTDHKSTLRVDPSFLSSDSFSTTTLSDIAGYFPKDNPPVIVLDQIDILPDREADLDWLPIDKTTIIVAVRETSAKIMDSLKRKGANIVRHDYPDTDFRKKLIRSTLEKYGKHLSEDLLSKIADAPVLKNLSALHTLTDELVCFGKHEDLHLFIENYTAAENIPDFYSRFWARIHMDFPTADRTVGLIALSQYGISEYELLDLSGIKQLEWSRLRSVLYSMITSDGPGLRITDTDIIKSVLSFYHKKTEEWRNILFEYFHKHPDHERSLTECAYQAYMLRDAKTLHTLLRPVPAFRTFEERQPDMLKVYWKYLDAEGYGIAEYLEDTENEKYFKTIGDFIRETSISRADAVRFYKRSIAYFEKANDNGAYNRELTRLYIRTALLLREQKKEYGSYFEKAMSAAESEGMLATIMIDRGIQYMDELKYESAEEYFRKALAIYKRLSADNKDYIGDVGRACNNLQNALDGQNRIDDAISAGKEAVRYLKQGYSTDIGYGESLFLAYANLTGNLESAGRYRDACTFCREALEMFDKTNHPAKHFFFLQTFAELSLFLENYDEALHAATEAADYFRKTSDNINLMLSLGHIGSVYRRLEEKDKMTGAFTEAVSIYNDTDVKSLGYDELVIFVKSSYFLPPFIERTEFNLSSEERARRYSISGRIYENLLYIKDKFPDIHGIDEQLISERLARSYYNRACIHMKSGNTDAALEMFDKILALDKSKEYRLDTFISLAKYYDNIGNPEKTRQCAHMAIDILVPLVESRYGFGQPPMYLWKRELENILSILDKSGEHIEYGSLVKGPSVPYYRPVPYRKGRPCGFCTKDDSIWSWRRFCLKSATGDRLTEDIYCEIGNFSYGRAIVAIATMEISTTRSNVRYGFIDMDGKTVIPANYLAATEFHYGRAAVYDGKEWFFINPDGKRMIRKKEKIL